MDGALTHSLMSMLIAAELYKSTTDPSIHIYVDSSRIVLEHHRSFIPSTLVSQLEKKNPRQPQRIEPGSPALATGVCAITLMFQMDLSCNWDIIMKLSYRKSCTCTYTIPTPVHTNVCTLYTHIPICTHNYTLVCGMSV